MVQEVWHLHFPPWPVMIDIVTPVVEPEERLSDHVYEYDAKEHELFRSDRAEERAKQKEEKRDEKKERPSLKERLAEKKNDVMKMDADRKQPTADKKKEAVI